jgi:imidazolonepropionase-like amidohydrolase
VKYLLILFLTPLLWADDTLSPNSLIITDVNIVLPHEGKIVPHQLVVIKDGVITRVADFDAIPIILHTAIIPGTGKYLIPGLWDMHVHSAFIDLQWDEKLIYPLYIANGIIGVRDMGGDFEQLKSRRERIEKGELLGPHLFIGGPFLINAKADAQTISVRTPEDAHAAVDKVKNEGADFVKILSRLSRDSYFAIAEESKKNQIRFVGHVPDAISATEASNADQYSIEHLTGISLACSSQETELREKILAAMSTRDRKSVRIFNEQAATTYNTKKAAALFSTFINNNTWQVPTLIWTKTQSTLEATKWDTDPRLKYIPASIRKQWDRKELLQQTPAEILADYKNESIRGPKLVKAMQKAGVKFLAGSDGPDPYVFPGFSLHDELELLVQNGFTPAQALEAATTNPAIFMNKQQTYGDIEKDHAADLVLLEANPLQDIRNTRKIAAVIWAGKYYPREELDKMLMQVAEQAKQQ